jgi:hypothetical protein
MGWMTKGSGFESQWGKNLSCRPALRPTQPPIEWVLGVERPGREADHSPPTSAEVKKTVYPPPYVFMALCLISTGTTLPFFNLYSVLTFTICKTQYNCYSILAVWEWYQWRKFLSSLWASKNCVASASSVVHHLRGAPYHRYVSSDIHSSGPAFLDLVR